MKEINVGLEDESAISEINILADGRICIFGASLPILEMLAAVQLGDEALRRRIEAIRTAQARLAPQSIKACSAQNAGTMGNLAKQ